MGEQRQTPDGLPIVGQEVIDVFVRDVNVRDATVRAMLCLEIGQKTELENPYLVAYLKKAGRESLTDEERIAHMDGFLTCYELLRKQSESNQLDQI